MSDYDVIVIGAGHNGLVCACYLARAGLKVLVLEQASFIGGAVHTAQTIAGAPGYRFDTCSVVHNLINITGIHQELGLDELGLVYIETDPFSSSFFPDGSYIRFYRSVERTCQEIARFSAADAEAYARFIALADPIADASLALLRASDDDWSLRAEARRWLRAAASTLWRVSPLRLTSMVLGPYGALLEDVFETEHARSGLVTLAAHGTLGPQVPGVAFFVFLQAMYHRYGNWHARGGSGALARALGARLQLLGGAIRTSAAVRRIRVRERAEGVELANGELVTARAIVAAINPQTTLLQLVDGAHLSRSLRRRLAARHRSNAVQFVVHAALDRLPPWPDAPEDVWRGLQSVADSVAQVRQNFAEAEAGIAPTRPAPYVYTSSSIDASLAPAGKHTAYIACAAYPSRFADGTSWQQRGELEAERMIDAIDARAPGFRDSISGVAWRHAEDWERTIGLVGGHPMHLDITPEQVGPFRPLPELSRYRSPIAGLYLSGAGTPPAGGVAGVPGRAAARRVLADLRCAR